MRRLFQHPLAVAVVAALAVGVGSTAAFGLPWDIDMVDGQAVKAYSQPMRTLPEGVVSQDHMLTPRSFTPNYERTSDEGMALTSPLQDSEAVLAQGEKMYDIYCAPCHGDGTKVGPVGEPGRFPGVLMIAGSAGVAKSRTDGYIYLTIRNGGAIMPAYGWAMTDDELWSVVHYVRTLPDAKYIPPAPPTEEE